MIIYNCPEGEKEEKTKMKTAEEIINQIKETRNLYLNQCAIARIKLKQEMTEMSAQQIQKEMLYITDMESRAYAMFLLLEDLEELKEDKRCK